MLDYNGVINIYKEEGYTSHDVVAIVRKTLGRVKAGHTGTLDPAAEGVLPICIGKATKISEYLSSEIKAYRAELNLGIITDTYDYTGKEISVKPVASTKAQIEEAVKSFEGKIFQVPPMYSAIKVGGKKLYELAREGKVVERKEREITIYNIDILEFLSDEKLVLDVVCSKGTYIRSLCYDIGEKLGCGANMGRLLRTRSGDFYVENSIKLDELKKKVLENKVSDILLPIEKILDTYKKIKAKSIAEKYLYNGNKLNLEMLEKDNFTPFEEILIYDSLDKLIGLYRIIEEDNKKFAKPVKMFL